MTYIGFLALFVAIPVVVLSLLTIADALRHHAWFHTQSGRKATGALLAHIAIALVYTTPWDNYLVATRVWWYDPARVLGITLGWVPLEEYLFFVLLTLLAGLLLFVFARRRPPVNLFTPHPTLRLVASLAAIGVWLGSTILLVCGIRPATYLGLELAWAMLPIALQLTAGADILWHYRRSVVPTLAAVAIYLSLADAVAIYAGVWKIDPAQSLNALLAGILPIEELVFFLLTTVIVVFGLTLTTAPETWARWVQVRAALRQRGMADELTQHQATTSERAP